MSPLYEVWLRREAAERFGKQLHELSEPERYELEPSACLSCGTTLPYDRVLADFCSPGCNGAPPQVVGQRVLSTGRTIKLVASLDEVTPR